MISSIVPGDRSHTEHDGERYSSVHASTSALPYAGVQEMTCSTTKRPASTGSPENHLSDHDGEA